MKFFVAFLLVLAIVCPGTVTQGQTAPQKAKQGAVPKPRTQTLRVCQGVPIPEGYVIIAYMTSTACPHGAYVLKKQDDYESSLAVNAGNRQPAAESADVPKTTTGKRTGSTGRTGGAPNTTSRRSTPARGKTTPAAGDAAPSPAPATTRPRRVGATSANTAQPPSTAQSQGHDSNAGCGPGANRN